MNKIMKIVCSLVLVCGLVACTSTTNTSDNTLTTTDINNEADNNLTASDTEIVEEKSYTTKEDVAVYIHQFEHLPLNYITKSEARELGWVSSQGNLWDVAYGMCIGGDYFGNYEELLPTNTKYHECDVNYEGGLRGEDRLIYGDDGSIYFTNDHYQTFEQLY